MWLSDDVQGRRIDGAYSYKTQYGVGRAITASGVPRKELFVTSKIPIGSTTIDEYNATMENFKVVLDSLQVDYVDLLLIHWPGRFVVSSARRLFCERERAAQ